MRNFWHMQLHPGNPNWDIEEIKKFVVDFSVIGMGAERDGDRGAPNRFNNDMSVGDIVVIRHNGSPRYLVEVIGPCLTNEGDNKINVWFDIYRKIRIISDEGEKYKKLYVEETGESWNSGMFAHSSFKTANSWDFAHFWYKKVIR